MFSFKPKLVIITCYNSINSSPEYTTVLSKYLPEKTQWYIDTTPLSKEWPNISNTFTNGYAFGRDKSIAISGSSLYYSRVSRFENNTLFWRGRLMSYNEDSGRWQEGNDSGDTILNQINIRYYWIAIG